MKFRGNRPDLGKNYQEWQLGRKIMKKKILELGAIILFLWCN